MVKAPRAFELSLKSSYVVQIEGSGEREAWYNVGMTIVDYVKYYKDVSLSEAGWNQIDTLIVAILSYARIRGFREEKSFSEFIEKVGELKREKGPADLMASKVQQMVKILRKAKRYERVKVENFDDIINDKMQFGAMTWKVGRKKIVGFRGTDGTIVGWFESLKLSYEYPTKTHLLAREYLEEEIEDGDEVILCGHSKGGNLAVVGAMELCPEKRRAVKKIYNFDGPGVRDEQFKSAVYSEMQHKIVNVMPEKSYVGVLMLCGGKTVVVKSNARGLAVHFPTSWEVFGSMFVRGQQDKRSTQLHENTVTKFMEIDEKEVERVLAAIFKKLEKRPATAKLSLKDLLIMMESVKDMDAETKACFRSIIGSLTQKARG